jgi:hypothetical protein
MRELHGVMFSGRSSLELKRRALLFDNFHIWHLADEEFAKAEEYDAELDFLRSNRVVIDEPPVDLQTFAETVLADNEDSKRFLHRILHVHRAHGARTIEDEVDGTLTILRDDLTRMVTLTVPKNDAFDLVPIYELSLPETLPNAKAFAGSEARVFNDIASVVLESMPIPDDSCSGKTSSISKPRAETSNGPPAGSLKHSLQNGRPRPRLRMISSGRLTSTEGQWRSTI